MSHKKPSKKPLDPDSGNSSLNSEINAATSIQSSVTPEDYPMAERKTQADIVGKDLPPPRKRPNDAA